MKIIRKGQALPGADAQRESVLEILDTNSSGVKEVLTPDDLAELLGVSVWTIYAKTSRRNRANLRIELPPFFRIGKLVRFWRKDLVTWLESRKKIDPNCT